MAHRHYVHGILTRAISLDGVNPIPCGRVHRDTPYQDMGVLLFQSTSSRRLEDYIVWQSSGGPMMGRFGLWWQQIGQAGSLFDNIPPQEYATYKTEIRLCGKFWPHYDFYLVESPNPGTDVYIRRSWLHPSEPFDH